jgi:hypothetical protein
MSDIHVLTTVTVRATIAVGPLVSAALLEENGIQTVATALCDDHLTFVSDDDPPTELVAGGANLKVTQDNLHSYICQLSEHILCAEARDELRALLRGFWCVVPLDALLEAHVDFLDIGMLLSGSEWRAPAHISTRVDTARSPHSTLTCRC